MEEEKKVLVLIPTNGVKGYVAGKFFKQLGKLDTSNADILFAEDSTLDKTGDGNLSDLGYYQKLIEDLGYECIKNQQTVKLAAEYVSKGHELPLRHRLCLNRTLLRQEFLSRTQYSHALWIDSDVLIPKDTIPRLLSHGKDIVSGVYWQDTLFNGVQKKDPVAYKFSDKETYEMYMSTKAGFDNFGHTISNEELNPSRLIPEDEDDIQITGVGFGCVLVSRKVMSDNWSFRYNKQTIATEDMWWSIDVKKLGYKIYLDTHVRCRHYSLPWKGEV